MLYSLQGTRHTSGVYACVHIAQHVVQTPNPKLKMRKAWNYWFLSCVCDASKKRTPDFEIIMNIFCTSNKQPNVMMHNIHNVLHTMVHSTMNTLFNHTWARYRRCILCKLRICSSVTLSYSNEVLYLRHTLKKKLPKFHYAKQSALAFLNSQFTFILWVFPLSRYWFSIDEWTHCTLNNNAYCKFQSLQFSFEFWMHLRN